MPAACTIAGSDSGGGAGIQADIKTFSACGVYGASVVVAVTAQNTVGVSRVETISAEMVAAQIDAVATDIQPAAWKTGMLATSELIEVVSAGLRRHRAANLVVDPVMVAKSGDRLLSEDAVRSLVSELFPLAAVLTPNLPEAEVLTGMTLGDEASVLAAARRLAAMGPGVIVMKGGHRTGHVVTDLVHFRGGGRDFSLSEPRVPGTSTHGTGCTFSAAIASFLARGCDPETAVRSARAYLQDALLRAPGIGAGHGPLGHSDPAAAARPVRR
jgi:hydroxymethylpyrimidine/phosphomethylpyrimidine kinase